MTTSDSHHSDEAILHALGLSLSQGEPLPPRALEFATGAFAWRDVEGDLAELLHDSVLEEAVVLRDETCLRLLVFQAGDITLDIEQTPKKLNGSLSPPATYRVALHDGTQPAVPTVLTDEAGMFELTGGVRGPVRFVVSDPDGQVAIVSPWVTL